MSRLGAAYHHGNLRAALVEAGMELIETQPVDRVSLREVARATGVSHAAPYHHFGDRADLLKAIGDQAMTDFVAVQERAYQDAAAQEPADRLVTLGLAYVTWAHAHPHAFDLVFDPELCPPGNPSPERAALIARNEALLDEAVGGLGPPRPVDDLATGLWAAVHGMAALVRQGHLPMEAVASALRALLP